MLAQATTTVTIIRGTTVDTYGDTVDTGATTVAADVPMSILEQRKTVFVPADGRVVQVRYYTGRVNSTIDVQVGDQVVDNTATVYVVEDVTRVTSTVVTNDSRVDLRKID